MPNLNKLTPEQAKELFDWYWTYGCKRKGAYLLSRGGWFDKLHRTLSRYSDIRFSETHFKRPAVAIWGPSQSGKSTLLATFIDHEDGALNWAGDNFKFVASEGKRLNPNNRGSDASGCVTRYVMRNSVLHEDAPAEIQFARERDVFMSLAFGYLSEMEGIDKDGRQKYFDAESLRKLLEDAKGGRSNFSPKKEFFPMLAAVADVLEALIKAKQERYSNLGGNQWAVLRNDIFNCDALLESEDSVMNFAAEVFWDGWESLTDICWDLLGKLKEITRRFSGKKVFCSLDLASILLDIAAAENAESKEKIADFGIDETAADAVVIGRGHGAFSDENDFALTQALVAVLVIPLRDRVIEKANPALFELLKIADIVDFPGIANEERGVRGTQLNNEILKANRLLGLTKVLKRGKTASIVIGYSRNLDIDVFALLMRMNKYPPKPDQLNAGIASWFAEMLQKDFSERTAAELPINIVQTFASELVNSVRQTAINKKGLREIFEKNDRLGALCKPGCVKYFAVNYPQFKPECDISAEGEELGRIIEKIENDGTFSEHYAGTSESLRQMCGLSGPGGNDGGRTYLFEYLLKQVKSSTRQNLLDRKKRALGDDFSSVIEEAIPADGDENARRREDIQRVYDGIVKRAAWDHEIISREILRFSNIRPEDLAPVPVGVSEDVFHKYSEDVLDKVKFSLTQSRLGTAVGVEEEFIGSRIAAYFMDGISSRELKKWICKNLSVLAQSDTDDWKAAARRPLALHLAAQLLRRGKDERHRDDAQDYFSRVSEKADEDIDYRYSPDYVSVIAPFLKTLKNIAQESTNSRGCQEGDNELRAIINSLND